MVRNITALFFLSLFLLLSCNKGLTLPEEETTFIEFPLLPEGGNPVGVWYPDMSKPVEIVVLDEEQIPSIVDSLIIETQLEGIFSLEVSGICSVNACLTLIPNVYLQGLTTPLTLMILDTICGQGQYKVINDLILYLPIESTNFQMDTLGFTSEYTKLDLITRENIFDYMGIIQIPIYFVFHLARNDVTPLAKPVNKCVLYRKEEVLP